MHRMHDHRHAGERRRNSSQHSSLRAVSVHDIGPQFVHAFGQFLQRDRIGLGRNRPHEFWNLKERKIECLRLRIEFAADTGLPMKASVFRK